MKRAPHEKERGDGPRTLEAQAVAPSAAAEFAPAKIFGQSGREFRHQVDPPLRIEPKRPFQIML